MQGNWNKGNWKADDPAQQGWMPLSSAGRELFWLFLLLLFALFLGLGWLYWFWLPTVLGP